MTCNPKDVDAQQHGVMEQICPTINALRKKQTCMDTHCTEVMQLHPQQAMQM